MAVVLRDITKEQMETVTEVLDENEFLVLGWVYWIWQQPLICVKGKVIQLPPTAERQKQRRGPREKKAKVRDWDPQKDEVKRR